MQSAYLALSRTEDVLEASSILLDEAMANESVDVGGFYLYDTKRSVLQLLNTRNVSDEVARILKEYRPNSDKWKSSVLKKKKPVFTDYRRLVSRHAKNPYTRSLLLKENIRALAIIPFLHNGHVIATLDVGSRSKGAFSKETKTNLVDLVRDTGDTLHRIVASAERREASVSRERMMNVISDNLLKRQREWEIGTVLRILGESLGIDRAYIYQFRDAQRSIDNTYEWCAPGVEPHKHALQDLEASLFPWWLARLRDNEVTCIGNVDDLPPAAGKKRELYMIMGVKSALFVPIFVDGELWGCIGFDQISSPHQWGGEEIRTIRIVAMLFEDAIHRKRLTEMLLEQNEELKKRAEKMEDYVQSLFHDAQTPLVSIFSYAELIKEYADSHGDLKLRELAAVIEKNTLDLSNVAKNLGMKMRNSDPQ